MQRGLAIAAIVPAVATVYFWVFWTGFGFWRRHRALTYLMMLGSLGGTIVAAVVWRDWLLGTAVDVPVIARVVGWALAAFAFGFGTIADRQIGIHVRSFAPFFEEAGRIELKTSGAYGVVRHPIYAAGIWFQLGTAIATGYLAVAIACAVLTLGALWFTRQEERRLIPLLTDPEAYAAYRARVPALFPSARSPRAAPTR
jgi:protein-S-isoprenylcysteine O-methyltransferase Ste14